MGAVADVRAYLEAESLVGGDWPAVERRMHDATDQLVVISEDGGPPPEIGRIDDTAALVTLGVLVTIRGAPWDAVSAQAQADLILTAFHGLTGEVIGSTEYIGVVALTAEPVFAGFEEQTNRPLFTVALRLTRGV
jgi:hypothetical protein